MGNFVVYAARLYSRDGTQRRVFFKPVLPTVLFKNAELLG
jgi:hypothetical protein